MRETLRSVHRGRLERSCARRPEYIRLEPAEGGIARAEVFLSVSAYAPHRHDTYAIGITTEGVQTFRYRGERRVCLPGDLHVLHPDELHDGAAGTDDGFGYRIVYVAPELVSRALGGRALPFVSDPVQPATPATRRLATLLFDAREPLDELSRLELAAAIADTLDALAGGRRPGAAPVDYAAVDRVREYLAEHAAEQTRAATLEQVSGLDRFSLSRQFRGAFGTSPDRYRTLRRLELARADIENGAPLVAAAARAGFADQSHLTRQFKRAYGLTPARWAKTISATP